MEKQAYVIYGPPGSGKTTYAKTLLYGLNPSIHIERDNIRSDIYGLNSWADYKFSIEKEFVVDAVWKSLITRNVENIVISDTLCKKKDRKNLVELLKWLGYDIHMHRMSTNLEECIRRDALRGDRCVGEFVIKRMWENLNADNEHY